MTRLRPGRRLRTRRASACAAAGAYVYGVPSAPRAGELEGRVAVITGAARGIGHASALEFAAQGAAVVVADRRPEVAEIAAEIARAGGRAVACVVDVTDADAVRGLVDAALASFGGLDVMFNNAGITGIPKAIVEMDDGAFDRVLAVNVRGVFLGLKYALPVMIAQGSGSVINTSSVTAVKAMHGMAAYTASKHAIVGLTRVAAIEAGGYGVRVNALLPGPTATALIGEESFSANVPLGRVAEPAEQARVACFLASDRSSFINGETILVDGGMAYAGT
jgi:NAD(P)-dependent dehydrogenase (short-subunit alcohol dehydrogenase family)